MTAWTVLLRPRAVSLVIDALADDPRPPGVKALSGHRPWLRARAGDYRVIYMADDAARVIRVAVIGHRREVYRNLDL